MKLPSRRRNVELVAAELIHEERILQSNFAAEHLPQSCGIFRIINFTRVSNFG
jgi:hypothetical protein